MKKYLFSMACLFVVSVSSTSCAPEELQTTNNTSFNEKPQNTPETARDSDSIADGETVKPFRKD